MTRLIRSLSDFASGYDALFCDLWGCVHNGETAFPAALCALRNYRANGGFVVLMTNAPRPAADVAKAFPRLGITQDSFDIVVSSGDATREALASGMIGTRIYHIGPVKDESLFAGLPAITCVPLAEAHGILCTGPFHEDTEVPETYRATFLLAKAKGLKLLCANPDLVVDLGDRRIYCGGALAQLYDQMGGTSYYFGKPHPPIYDIARSQLAARGIQTEHILCIGDGITTDIAGGIAESFDTLFVTGGLSAEAFGSDPENPDLSLLTPWLQSQSLSPTAAIGRLR